MSQQSSPGAADRSLAGVQAAVQASDYDRAISLARRALDEGEVHPLFLNLRAFWLEQQNRNEDALADLQRARTLAPRDVPVLNALGLSLLQCERAAEAIEAFSAALAEQPDFLPARFSRARSADRIGDLVAARADYEEVIRRQPQHADALAGLSFVLCRLGEWEAACELAERALAADPNQAIATLALGTAEIESGKWLEAERRLTEVLNCDGLPPATHALALSLMADALDGQRRCAEAFNAYRAANDELYKLYAPRFEATRTEAAYAYVCRLIEYFEHSGDWPKPASGFFRAEYPASHIFVLGFPRSGTTLFEQAIGNHPLAMTTEENEALADSVRVFMSGPDALERLRTAGEQQLAPLREAYFHRVRNAGFAVSGKVLIDKLPLNTIKLPLIARLFPDAKIVFAIRDPRDVVLSCFRRRFAMNPSMFEFLTLEGTARYYDAVMRLAELCGDRLGITMHTLRHEALIRDFDGEMRSVCKYAGIQWSERMRAFGERAKSRAVATPSAVQLIRGLNNKGIGHWRNYAEQIGPVLPVLRPWIDKFGYG